MRLFRPLLLSAALLGLGACASMHDAPARITDGVLTNASGMTLYTFDNDPTGSGKSTCNGPCASNWPPLVAATGSKAVGDYAVITRDDGILQWAYKGKPLYLWVKDTRPGERTGDGFRNVWRVARP